MSTRRNLRDWRHARLLTLAKSGSGTAFQRLYRELYDPVARYLGSRVESPEDAEDLVAEVFHRFLGHLADFDRRRGSVLSWLLTIARHALVDHYRARKENLPIDDLAEILAGQTADPLGEILRDEEAMTVRAVLRELPAETQEMIALRFGHDLRYREIAALMGMSEPAIKQRFSRTLRELRVRLQGHRERGGEVDYAV